MAHQLHVSILSFNEEAMGPRWFYEGFAIIASSDLISEPIGCEDAFLAIKATGPNAYKKYAAALRCFMTKVPLEIMVQKASEKNFEDWLRTVCK
jgi:hypothetical protein